MSYCFVRGPNFTKFYPSNARGIMLACSQRYPIFGILIRSTDIHGRSLKLSEMAPNFARFWPPFWGRSHKSWTQIMKLNTLPIMWQSFTAIGRGSSEISR